MKKAPRKNDAARVMTLYPRIFFACHTRHVRDEASGAQLTSHQASILDHLDERDPLRVTELAEHMGVTPATMSIHIDRLERMGFVSRQRSERDARQVELRLTDDGVRVRDAKSVLDAALVERMLGMLTASERREAIHGLALLAGAATASMKASAKAAGGGGSSRRSRAG
jgi:MarR family transcriptional regulator, organic hydroperoxide resistance regulator